MMKDDRTNVMPLSRAPSGSQVVITRIIGGRGFRRRLSDMGLVRGASFRVVKSFQPGPCVISFQESKLGLGHGMASKIMVKVKE